MDMRHSQRQEMRITSTGFGGYSPFIEGLPIGRYRELSPGLKIEYRNPQYFRCTDRGNDLEKILDISEEWVKSIHRGVEKGNFEYPLICPVVIADVYGDEIILDGNSRSAATSMHSEKMPVIVVEEPKDLAAVRKLAKSKHFYWIHGNKGGKKGFDELIEAGENAAERVDLTPDRFLENVAGRYDWSWGAPESSSVYFTPEVFGDSALRYALGRVAFENQLGEAHIINSYVIDRDSFPTYFEDLDETPRVNLREEIEQYGLKDRIRGIIKSSGLKSLKEDETIERVTRFLSCGTTDYEACLERLRESVDNLKKSLKKE